jgi:hypothetical protein
MMRITYDVKLVPEGGTEVYSGMSELVKRTGKDPAGRAFHHLCLLQAGLVGTRPFLHLCSSESVLVDGRFFASQACSHRMACIKGSARAACAPEKPDTSAGSHQESNDKDGSEEASHGDDKNTEGCAPAPELVSHRSDTQLHGGQQSTPHVVPSGYDGPGTDAT